MLEKIEVAAWEVERLEEILDNAHFLLNAFRGKCTTTACNLDESEDDDLKTVSNNAKNLLHELSHSFIFMESTLESEAENLRKILVEYSRKAA